MSSEFVGAELPSPFIPGAVEWENLRDLMRTHRLPQDTSRLEATILAAPALLKRYDIEINQLREGLDQERLARLISERDGLASYTEGCRSILSPVHRLPNELLSEIFHCCFPSELYRIVERITSVQEIDRLSHRHLLRLAQVSSRWYRIAMDTPKLWSTIAVDTSLWPVCLDRVSLETLLNWLELALTRGRGHALELQVGVTTQYGDTLFELLSQHACRWQTLYIWSSSPQPSKTLSNAFGRLDRLERLELDVMWENVDVFQSAPLLKEVSFPGDNLPQLPWDQIQMCTYRTSGITHTWFSPFSLLNLATNATTFSFSLDLRDLDMDQPANLDIQSNVEHLSFRLSTSNSAAVGQLLDCLTLPSLKSLSVQHPVATAPPVWCSNNFLTLAARSGFGQHLKRLSIHAAVEDTELLRCLVVLLQLEELIIVDCPSLDVGHAVVTDTFLRALISDFNSAPLMPKLRLLGLRSLLEFSDPLYIDLVASRAEKLHVDGNGPFKANLWWRPARRRDASVEMLDELAQLVSKGLLIFDSGEGK
ncbi:hypothetical protein R3P38DRAFT_2868837 [Favolaschia claudopus]|uniref:F-box domain-containing protein n=1 Tax=Favolaschia claudopus TaxID=2862362 RepID=A0AAW0DBF5_9AGAR